MKPTDGIPATLARSDADVDAAAPAGAPVATKDPPCPAAGSRNEVLRRHSFAAQLVHWSNRLGRRPTRLDELSRVFQGRTSNVLLILLALPFLTPIPLPLLSVPFGLMIAMTGLCMALRRRPWLPTTLGARELPADLIPRVLSMAGRLVGWLERVARPRWVAPGRMRLFRRVTGIGIALGGAMLLLPLPVPFSNFLPASAVVLLALGGLQRDGLCALAGGVALVLSVSYLVAIGCGGAQVLAYFTN